MKPFMSHFARSSAMTLIVGFLALSLQSQASASESNSVLGKADWSVLVHEFIEDYFCANPNIAVNAGRHEFDGQIRDVSRAALQREVGRLNGWKNRLEATDLRSGTPAQRFEKDYALAVISEDLFWLQDAERPFLNPDFYIYWFKPDFYLNREYAPLDTRLRAYMKHAQAVAQAVPHVRANLRIPLPKTFAEYGAKTFRGFAEFYEKKAAAAFAAITDKSLLSELQRVNATVAQTMREQQRWFEAQAPHATGDFALGKDLFEQMLRDTEQIDVPVDRLEAVGRADLDANLRQLNAACQKLFPGKAVADCVLEADLDKPKDGAVAGARVQVAELRDFV